MGVLFGYPTPLDGESAYQIAVDNGFVGTEQQWLVSLKGNDGATPEIGTNGNWFINGTDTGVSSAGTPGLSAYQIWLNNGHVGSEAQFLAWLQANTANIGLAQVWDPGTGANIQNMTGQGKYVKIGDLVVLHGFVARSGASLAPMSCKLPAKCGSVGFNNVPVAQVGGTQVYVTVSASSDIINFDAPGVTFFGFSLSYIAAN